LTSRVERLVDEGNAAADRGDHRDAIRLFEIAISAGAPWAALNLGNSYRAVGDYKRAEAAFEAAWNHGEDDAGFNLALLYQDVGRIAETREVFGRLIKSGYTKAMDQEAWYLREEGDIAAANKLMSTAALSTGPDGDRAAGVLGTWMWEDHADLAAEPFLRRGVSMYPPARADLAEMQIRAGKFDEAEASLREGVARGEDDSLIPLANLLQARGEEDEAELLLRTGTARGDSHAPYNLALLLQSRDRDDEAMAFLQLAADRGDTKARRRLRRKAV